jgi:hypothetical protein
MQELLGDATRNARIRLDDAAGAAAAGGGGGIYRPHILVAIGLIY